MYEDVDFQYINDRLNEVACGAYSSGFYIARIEMRDDWAAPGNLIVHVYLRRDDFNMIEAYSFRSNGKRVTGNSYTSLRSKVRNRNRKLVEKMERRINRTAPDADGFYRRPVYDDY